MSTFLVWRVTCEFAYQSMEISHANSLRIEALQTYIQRHYMTFPCIYRTWLQPVSNRHLNESFKCACISEPGLAKLQRPSMCNESNPELTNEKPICQSCPRIRPCLTKVSARCDATLVRFAAPLVPRGSRLQVQPSFE